VAGAGKSAWAMVGSPDFSLSDMCVLVEERRRPSERPGRLS
jgi:hypothetical protein